MYNGAFSFNKRNFGLNGEGRGSLTEVFCTVSYTLCTWVLKILRHTFIYLMSGWSYWNTSLKGLVKSGSCSLVLKTSSIQKISFFYLQSIFLYVACLHDLICDILKSSFCLHSLVNFGLFTIYYGLVFI